MGTWRQAWVSTFDWQQLAVPLFQWPRLLSPIVLPNFQRPPEPRRFVLGFR